MFKLEATTKQVTDQLQISARCVETGLELHQSIVLKKSLKKITARLLAAINDGVVFTNVRKSDGGTFILCSVNVSRQYLDSDLTRLGF